MEYRRDIQILRGIAVLMVVLFHLELGLYASGFLGVDVFFVISGFLMALLYTKNNKKEFYIRRIRRLLPAYFVTISAVLVVSFFIVLLHEFDSISRQSLYASFFASNFGFWMENEYFNKQQFKPLLHLWSLGVEIQFYIFLPIVFFIVRKKLSVLVTILAASFVACLFVVSISTKTSFFITPFRLWEFLLGMTVAWYVTSKGAIKQHNKYYFGSLGLILICTIPMLSLDVLAHPGWAALIVSLATCAVLAYGVPLRLNNSIIGIGLENIGMYSYSIYLVHFPVILFYSYEPFAGSLVKLESFFDLIAVVGIVSALSAILYHFVEIRFHRPQNNKIHLKWVIIAFPLLATVSLFSTDLQKLLYNDNEKKIMNAWFDREDYRCGKINRLIHPASQTCEIGEVDGVRKQDNILLVGDSHANAIKTVIASAANDMGLRVFLMVGNWSVGEGYYSPQYIFNVAKKLGAKKILLHEFSGQTNVDAVERLVMLTSGEGVQIIYIDPVPVWDKHIPKFIWRNTKTKNNMLTQSFAQYTASHDDLFTSLARIQQDHFIRVNTADVFCRRDCIYMDDNGAPLYFDSDHLTITGAMYLKSTIARVLVSE